MAFRFSLATVLRVRVLREEREERMLQQIFHEIARTQQSIVRMDADITQASAQRAAQVLKTVEGRDVQLSARETENLYECRKGLEAQLEKLEQLKDAQVGVYQAARRDREMLNDLRSRRRVSYDAALALQEQKRADDNFNARRLRA